MPMDTEDSQKFCLGFNCKCSALLAWEQLEVTEIRKDLENLLYCLSDPKQNHRQETSPLGLFSVSGLCFRHIKASKQTQVRNSTWSRKRLRGGTGVLFWTESLKNKCQIKWLKQKYHCCLTGYKVFPFPCWFVRKELMLKDRWSFNVHDPNTRSHFGGLQVGGKPHTSWGRIESWRFKTQQGLWLSHFQLIFAKLQPLILFPCHWHCNCQMNK